MNHRFRVRVLTLALIACAGSALAQTASLSNYVALGDSLTAGVVNSTVVETHQRNSYPALIALQAGLNLFAQPTVTEPGIPPELQLVALLPATVIGPKSPSAGTPNNLGLPRPYNNLGIPTSNTPDYVSRTTDGGGPFDLVLRGLGTGLAQAVALRANLYTVWLGNNDVLTAVVRGTAVDGTTLTPTATFRTAYTEVVTALRATGATVIVATIPDVTKVPFVTTIPPFVINPATREPVLVGGSPVALIGPSGPLPPGAFVTLAASSLLAQGVGIPTSVGGSGTPLPAEVILDQGEVAVIQDRVQQNNQAIRDVATANGATVLDLNAVFEEFNEDGRVVGGVSITSQFLTGGAFGYDGIHPTDLGYAILANEWIGAINASGVADLPVVNLAPFLGLSSTASAGRSAVAAMTRTDRAFEFSAEAYEQLLRFFPTLDGQ
jgi:lysophospholipase L1-like esterase